LMFNLQRSLTLPLAWRSRSRALTARAARSLKKNWVGA